jgi:hypothetical protein
MATKGFVVLTLQVRQSDKRWPGECLELGTATDGRSLKEVHSELMELVLLHLESLEAVGERERFFREHRITLYSDDAVPTAVEKPIPVDADTYVHAQRVRLPVAS